MAEVKLPPNSDASLKKDPEEKPEKREIKSVVKSGVTAKKQSLGNKIKSTFVTENGKDIKGYVIFDVVLPYLKDTLYDAVTGALKMILFGDTNANPRRSRERDRGKSYWSYTNIYNDRDRRPINYSDSTNLTRVSYKKEAAMDFTDFVFDSRADAENVLGELSDLTIDYGVATVSDLYDLVGMDHEYTTDNYGWTDLSKAYISRERYGYVINLPRPKGIR